MKKGIRIGLRVAAVVVVALAGLFVVAFVALQSSGLRGRVLAMALDRADHALPGHFEVERSSWPDPGRIELRGVTWLEGPDTLLSARSVTVSVGLQRLLRRDLDIEKLALVHLEIDAPRLGAALGRGNEGGGRGYLRSGAMPSVPSLAVRRLIIDGARVRLSETTTVADAVVRGRVEVLHGRAPRLLVEQLSLKDPRGAFVVDSLRLDVDLAAARVEGGGTGALGPDVVLRFGAVTPRANAFEMHWIISSRAGAWEPAGVEIEGSYSLDGWRPATLDATARFRTPAAGAMVPAAAAWLTRLGETTGTVRFRSAFAPEFECRAEVETGDAFATVSVEGSVVTLDTLSLVLPDLDLRASGRRDPSSTDVTAVIDFAGTRWLQRIAPGTTAPDSLEGRIVARVHGPSSAPVVDLGAGATIGFGTFRVDSVGVDASIPVGKDDPARVDIGVISMGVSLGTRATIRRGDRVRIDLEAPPLGAANRCAIAGRVFLRDGEAEVPRIELTGALGEHRLAGSVSRDGAARIDARLAWPTPPLLLRGRVGADWDSLCAAWERDGPFRIDSRIVVSPSKVGPRVTANGSLLLPGPSTLAPVLGRRELADHPGAVAGVFAVRPASCAEGGFAGTLDVHRSAWIDTAIVRMRMCGNRLDIDTVAVSLEGLALFASGTRDGAWWDVDGRAEIARELSPTVETTASAVAGFVGTLERPELTCDIDAVLDGSSVQVPRLVGHLAWKNDRVTAAVEAPDGATAGPIRLDRASASYRSSDPGAIDGSVALDAAGQDIEYRHTMRVSRTTGLEVATDTLSIFLGGKSLVSKAPFLVRVFPDSSRLIVESLDLAGTLGSIRVDGRLAPNETDLTADVEVMLPPKPRSLAIADELWPSRASAHLQASHDHLLQVEGAVDGFSVGGYDNASARLTATAREDGVDARVDVTGGGKTLAHAALVYPAALTVYPPRIVPLEGGVSGELELAGFPVPSDQLSLRVGSAPKELGRVDGTVAVGGSMVSPTLRARLRWAFPRHPALSPYSVSLDATAGGDSTDAITLTTSIEKQGREVLSANVVYPGSLSLRPPAIVARPDGKVRAAIHAMGLDLSDLNAFLPPDVGVEGECRLTLNVDGGVDDPDVRGSLATSGFHMSTPDGTSLSADTELRVEGTVKAPNLIGEVRVTSGVIRLPEPPKQLLPQDGPTLLALPDRREDSAVTPTNTRAQTAARNIGAEITLVVPSGLWIRGNGLEAELAGELHVVLRDGQPSVTGQLDAVRGGLLLLGRSFRVDSGSVRFLGEESSTPTLDLVMSTIVEGTIVNVTVRGTLDAPELVLTSDPEMTEGDIMSLLLFGKPLEELDHDQMALVQRRATEVAATFGTARLEAIVSRQLGVDMVTIKRREARGTSLVLGKYLSRRALLRYEQSLEEKTSYQINLEYFLTRYLKLETFLDRQSASGLELNWFMDY